MATNKIELLLSANDQATAALKNVSGGLGDMQTAVRQLLPLLGSVGAALGVREIIDSAVAWDGYEKALTAITGSGAGARKELDYIWETADRLGVGVNGLADSWVKFMAAAKGTVLEGQAARDVFEAVTQATVRLGLSSDETRGALNAVQQMMSKGKVSAEELRQQLGERVPGAFQLFAKAAGVSTAELDKMLQSGKVGIDILPKVADELNKVYGSAGQAESARQAMERFGNAVEKFKLELSAAGVLDVFIGAMKALQETLGDQRTIESIRGIGQSFEGIASGSGPALVVALEGVVKGFQLLAIGGQTTITALQLVGDIMASVGAAVAFAAEGDFKEAWEILQDSTPADNFNRNMDALEKSTSAFWGAADKAAGGARTLGDEAKAAAGKTGELTTATGAATAATAKDADTKKALADEAKKAAEQIEKQRQEAVKLALEMEKIASNERIKKMELLIGLQTERLRGDVEVAKQIIGTLNTSIQSTGDLLGGLFGTLLNATKGGSWSAQRAIEDQIKRENDRRDQAFESQKKLTDAQVEALRAKTKALNEGKGLINITLDGVEPELETILWKIVDRVQAKVNEEASELLIGVGI